MRVMFLGDIVGTPGVKIVRRAAGWLRSHYRLDLLVANAENASAGSGLYPTDYRKLKSAGIDGFTMGDHIYKRVEIVGPMNEGASIAKPINYPAEAPGRDWLRLESSNGPLAIISVMGRTFMRHVDCPLHALDRVLAVIPNEIRAILVDVHAEATGDKYLIWNYLRGRVSAVIGTHTHVPTADEQVSSEGTAFLCDVGMTGPYEGILGRKYERVKAVAYDFVPQPFDVATGDVRIGAVLLEIDARTGKASTIERLAIRENELPPSVRGSSD